MNSPLSLDTHNMIKCLALDFVNLFKVTWLSLVCGVWCVCSELLALWHIQNAGYLKHGYTQQLEMCG